MATTTQGQVQVSVHDEAAGTWSAWATVGTAVSRTSPVWSPFDVDLTAYAGKTIKLAFYNYVYPYPAAGAPGWYMDDIQILKKVPEFTASFSGGWGDWYADNGVWQIGVPTIGPMGCHAGTQCATTGTDGDLPVAHVDQAGQPPARSSRRRRDRRDSPSLLALVRLWGQPLGASAKSRLDEAAGTWSDWVNVGAAVSNNSLVWTVMDIDLTLYAGRIRLAFFNYVYPYPAAGAPGWYIDSLDLGLRATGLSVTKTGPGSGTVTSSPAGIDSSAASLVVSRRDQCPAGGHAARVGSVFGGWSGACSGLGEHVHGLRWTPPRPSRPRSIPPGPPPTSSCPFLGAGDRRGMFPGERHRHDPEQRHGHFAAVDDEVLLLSGRPAQRGRRADWKPDRPDPFRRSPRTRRPRPSRSLFTVPGGHVLRPGHCESARENAVAESRETNNLLAKWIKSAATSSCTPSPPSRRRGRVLRSPWRLRRRTAGLAQRVAPPRGATCPSTRRCRPGTCRWNPAGRSARSRRARRTGDPGASRSPATRRLAPT